MDFLTLSNDQTFYVFPLIFCIPLHFVYFMLHHDGLSVVCWISLSVCACVSPTIIFNGGTSTLNNFSFLEYCLPAVYFLPAWLACWWAMEYTFDCLCVCEWLTTPLVVAVVGVMPYFANINCKCNNKQQQYQQFLSHTNTLHFAVDDDGPAMLNKTILVFGWCYGQWWNTNTYMHMHTARLRLSI